VRAIDVIMCELDHHTFGILVQWVTVFSTDAYYKPLTQAEIAGVLKLLCRC
jgi:hypothetical protein